MPQTRSPRRWPIALLAATVACFGLTTITKQAAQAAPLRAQAPAATSGTNVSCTDWDFVATYGGNEVPPSGPLTWGAPGDPAGTGTLWDTSPENWVLAQGELSSLKTQTPVPSYQLQAVPFTPGPLATESSAAYQQFTNYLTNLDYFDGEAQLQTIAQTYLAAASQGVNALLALLTADHKACPQMHYILNGYSEGALVDDYYLAGVADGAYSVAPSGTALAGNPLEGYDGVPEYSGDFTARPSDTGICNYIFASGSPCQPSTVTIPAGTNALSVCLLDDLVCNTSNIMWAAQTLINSAPDLDPTALPALINDLSELASTTLEVHTHGYISQTYYMDGENVGAAVMKTAAPCHQVTQTDGSYEFSGCVTTEDDGDVDDTSQHSNLDGIDVSASPSDQVTYDDGGSYGDQLTSTGASTLSLNLAGTLIPIYTGTLDDSLTAPITVTVPTTTATAPSATATPAARAAGPSLTTSATSIAGLPISGKLTITPSSTGGTATAKASTTLPAALGGGTAALTATTTVGKGLTSVTVNASKASLLQLYQLSGITLTWKAGAGGNETWTLTATASTGGTTSTKLTGTLTYNGNTLQSADLSMTNISLAGLVNLTKLEITYSGTTWSGTANIGTGTTASITLNYTSTGLASGSIKATNISLFGVLNVNSFTLAYSNNAWTVDVTAADGGGVSGTMTATDGMITAASLKVTKVSFLGEFTVDTAQLSYAAQAPNSACAGVTGNSIWCGSWQVLLPSASVVDGVGGTLAVADGTFASGSINVTGNIPLLDGIVLTQLGGHVTVNPPPTTISGTAGLRFGPQIKGTALLNMTGTLTRQLSGSNTSGSYMLDGTLNALSVLTGHMNATVPGDNSPTTITLNAQASAGKVTATGTVKGSFNANSFTLNGNVTITGTFPVVGKLTISGTMAADNLGMAACGAYGSHQAGFEYDWATDSVTLLGTSGCSEKGF